MNALLWMLKNDKTWKHLMCYGLNVQATLLWRNEKEGIIPLLGNDFNNYVDELKMTKRKRNRQVRSQDPLEIFIPVYVAISYRYFKWLTIFISFIDDFHDINIFIKQLQNKCNWNV